MTTEQMQRLREGCVMAISKINVWRCDGCGLMRPDLDLGMTACKCGAGRWSVFDVAAALRASEERARKAEELAVANLAANKRIVALAHERDAARVELARLTTLRPIADAPRDGTWVLLPFSTSKWDACRGPSPQYVTARWFAAAWADPNGALLTEPTHYLPLPEVKP